MVKVPTDGNGKTVTVNERSSCILGFELEDPTTRNPIPSTSIISCMFTLTDKATDAVIGGHDEDDVLSRFDASGRFSMVLGPTDNAIVSTDPAVSQEVHVATFVTVATSGEDQLTLTEEIWITITNNQQS